MVVFSVSYIAMHTPDAFSLAYSMIRRSSSHPSPCPLSRGANQDREFGGLFVEFVLQAHQPKHVTSIFVDRDENHLVPVIEMGELVDLRSAQLGDA